MSGDLNELSEHLIAGLGSAILESKIAFGELTIEVAASEIVNVVRFLHDDLSCRFVCFTDLCGADHPEREKRFDVIYHLLSPYKNQRIRVKLRTDEMTPVPSLVEVFPAANWFERETFDLYGVLFSGHPDLRRILTDYGFEGHPLRKDFPLTGHVEIRYDDDEFRLRVRDDGKGIDPEVLAAQGIEGHYGLRGMPERAAVIGGNLTVWSEVGAGTEVELRLPAATVYATSARHSWWSRRFGAKAPADVEGGAS